VSALEMIRLAHSRLRTSRLRTFLTMLGVIIGVASVVALVGVGQGATSGITARLEGLGTNLLTVSPGSTTTGFTRSAAGSATTLTEADATAIAKLADIGSVEPEISTQGFLVAGDGNTTTTVLGTTPAYPTVRAYDIAQGSFFNQASVDNALRVVVLGATTASDLGIADSAVGRTITIAGVPFEVVGVLATKGTSGAFSQDDQAIIPITTARAYFSSGDKVRSIGVSVADASKIEVAKATIAATLQTRHGVTSTTQDFTISDQAQLLATFSSVGATLALLLGGIASISLLVGGIGIMNIMLVSVRERTREIGIRKAIGARGRDILVQFLIEALVISLIGGAIGIVVGLLVSVVISTVAGWTVSFSLLTIVAAVLFSLAVGVVFGVLPARQAARLDPIVALRYE
jgi:putative ABC transport system permease protein